MAAERYPTHHPHITVRRSQPLIGVLVAGERDEDVVTYFTDEDEADRTVTDAAVQAALALAGAWSDVPWNEIEAGLDRIRHESEPTPPLEL
jgi:hypothetical protein